jgi:hypothetical protein
VGDRTLEVMARKNEGFLITVYILIRNGSSGFDGQK